MDTVHDSGTGGTEDGGTGTGTDGDGGGSSGNGNGNGNRSENGTDSRNGKGNGNGSRNGNRGGAGVDYGTADIAGSFTARTQSLQFQRPPQARGRLTGPPGSRTESVRDRTNLPDRAVADAVYRDVRIERAFAIRLRSEEDGTDPPGARPGPADGPETSGDEEAG